MFVRTKTIRSGGQTYQYLHVVENRWENGKVCQHIVGSLGRLDQLRDSGDLERVITQLVERCPSVQLLRAQAAGTLQVDGDRVWGAPLLFERLWQDLGLQDLLRNLSRRRKLGFDFERMAFALTLQRLLEPGSDLRGSKWVQTVHAPGFEALRLPHFYRALGVLWKNKERIEEALYRRGQDLFNQELDLVFFDTTSTYFEGRAWEGWAKLGKSKDHRPDHLQLVLGVVMRRDGLPISCDIWPGNTADVKTVVPVIQKLQKRFRIRRVVFVCDRGMVSKKNLKAIRQAGYDYIVGMKMRRLLEVRDNVLARGGRYQEVADNLQVKEVWVQKRRYVICLNPEEAAKDRHDREGILAKIRDKLKAGGLKKLIGNRGYRRFLKVDKAAAHIDPRRVEEDARYDGKYVLRTTTEFPAADVARAYKQLTWIERLWRELKDVVEVRPIYHHLVKDNVKGHIFACFLAIYLVAFLKRKLEEANTQLPWDDILRDTSALRAVTVRLAGERFLMRTPVQGCAGTVFRVAGVKVPPLAQPV